MPNILTHIDSCVKSIYNECWYKDADQPAPMTEVMDIVGASKRFHAERLEAHREEIISLLYCLPLESRKSSGTGLLCTHAHLDKYGRTWTDSRSTMIDLFVLGMAIEKLTFYLPLGKTSVSECTLDTVMILIDDES
jgi:hypothetical protein